MKSYAEERIAALEAAVFPPPPTMICREPPPEPPKPDSDYTRAMKRAIVIAAHPVSTPEGERERTAAEIIHALMEEIDEQPADSATLPLPRGD